MRRLKKIKWNAAKAKRKLDKLFSSYILGRDKRICQWCGKNGGKMDTSHVIPRDVIKLRWNKNNAICLCFNCHKRTWHHHPLAAIRWFDQKYSTLGDELLTLSVQEYKFNEEEYLRIKSEIEDLLKKM